MKRIILSVTAVFIFIVSAVAQKINGKVTDEQHIPLAYVNVILQTADSTFLSGTTTNEDGLFELSIHEKAEFVNYSFIGYSTVVKKVASNMGVVVLKPDAQLLGEVVVKDYLPKTQIKGDALLTPVENSVLAKAGSANDVLNQLPGVIKSEDSFEVFGKGAAVIYINGRLVRDNAELEQLNSNEIKHVEVVHNPGARYDATVKAVIRIQTIKKVGDGFAFDLRSSVVLSQKNDYINQLNINYRHRGLDVFASLAYLDYSYIQDTDIKQTLYSKNLLEVSQSAYFMGRSSGLRPTLGFNYQINDKHSLGVRYVPYKLLQNSSNNDSYSIALIDKFVDDTTHTKSTGVSKAELGHQANFYYNGTVGKLNIDFNTDLLHSGNDDTSVYDEASRLQEDRVIETRNSVQNRLYASKLVFSYPLFKGNLSAGAEYTYTRRRDEYLSEASFIPSNLSLFEENDITAFVEYGYNLPFGGNVSAGLRYEHIIYDYYENNVRVDEQSRKYNNFYPNASFAAMLGKVQLMLSYAVKTNRPSYQQLSNAGIYIDRYSISKGTPTLRPEISHDVSLATVWKFLQFSLSYQHVRDAIVHLGTSQENIDNAMVLYYTNFANDMPKLSAVLSVAPTIGFWNPVLTAAIEKQWVQIDYLDEKIKLNKPLPYVKFVNNFKLPEGFMANIDYTFIGKGHTVIYELLKPTHCIDLRIKKSFFKDALNLEFRANDILKSSGDEIIMYSNTYKINQANRRDSREFIFTLRYNFNSAKSKYKGTGAGETQKNRM